MDSGGQEHPKVVPPVTGDAGRGAQRVPFKAVAVVVLIAAIPTLAFFQLAVNTVAYLVGSAPTVTFVARSDYSDCVRDVCHAGTHGITEPGGRDYDLPFAVQPGATVHFPGPVLGPFWPSINGSRPITSRSRQVLFFAGLILGYATLAGVTVAAYRQGSDTPPWLE